MSRGGFLLECYGLPGSGKTTLCAELARERGYVTTEQVRLRWRRDVPLSAKLRFLAAVVVDGRIWLAIARAALALRIWKSPDGLRRLATLPFLRARLRTFLLESEILVMDQCLIQEVWSALVSARNTEPDGAALTRLLRSLYQDTPVLLLRFDLNSARAAARIAGRPVGYSRYEGLGEGTIAALLLPGEGIVRRIAGAVGTAGLATEGLDAGRSLDWLVGKARAVLENARAKGQTSF